ncbi:TPA: phage tail tape measure protein [Vibrio parahaemolyticus]|uniref:phage tail tape measure protein n=1 Tax=Vibrio fluvialis TaxID=676 RepID=UPI00301E124E|nr:phage tail tape measure protein [Vibrio parahaemolyticus]
MTNKTVLNEYIYTLLIEKGLDGFTVPCLRDELLKITREFNDVVEARKFLYRNLLQLEQKGLLQTKGQGRKKTYHKSELFKTTEFKPKKRKPQKVKAVTKSPDGTVSFDELVLERRKYEAELAIALAEIEEFQLLSKRLPSQKSSLLRLSEETREKSVRYLAKINVINQALKLTNRGKSAC